FIERLKSPDDVLAGLDAVDAQDDLLISMTLQQLVPVLVHLRRLSLLFQPGHIDRDGKIPDVCNVIPKLYLSVLEIDSRASQVRLAGAQKVQPILPGLESQQIHGAQTRQDRAPHFRRQQPPVLRSRPRDMDEMGQGVFRSRMDARS